MGSILAERVREVPQAVATALRAPLPAGISRLRTRCRRFVATGGGLSEGPARVLVALLRRQGLDAQFISQSVFASPPASARVDADAETALILFSQGLAPNARLPIPYLGPGLIGDDANAAKIFGAGVLVTAVQAASAPGDRAVGSDTAGLARRLIDAGHFVWTLPPQREDGLLLRVIGPAVALVAAMRLAEAIGRGVESLAVDAVGSLEGRVARAIADPGLDLFGERPRPIAIVAEPELGELAMPLRWKLLEGLRVADPPIWDPLQVAHGPLQSFYDVPATLLCLRTKATRYDGLYARLRAVLPTDGRHRLIELRATGNGDDGGNGADLVELDAMLDACLLATLARHPLELDRWPSKGQDGPIYDVDPLVLAKEWSR